jgi:hypothetical protein
VVPDAAWTQVLAVHDVVVVVPAVVEIQWQAADLVLQADWSLLALSHELNYVQVPAKGSAVVGAAEKAQTPSVPPPLQDNLFV